MSFPRIPRGLFTLPLVVIVLVLIGDCRRAAAQSGDVAYPAPVYSNEIVASILPRDLGDARRTKHFYTFKGTEGDVLVTVQSSELNGDVDVFAAKTLRPLLKFTLYGGAATRATKSFYLRKEETLILRVDARAVGDAEGAYRILLGGSFAPATPDLARVEEPVVPASDTSTRRGTRRVTSTGARIPEPEPIIAEATPTPTPETGPADIATTEERPANPTASPRTRRGTPTRRAPSRTTRPAPTATPSETETNERRSEEASNNDERTEEATSPSRSAARSSTRTRTPPRSSRRRAPAPRPTETSESGEPAPATPAPVVTILRLVVLTKDGERREHDMSTVRRVIVENNQLVVVSKDGKISRTPLALVEKMSFEP